MTSRRSARANDFWSWVGPLIDRLLERLQAFLVGRRTRIRARPHRAKQVVEYADERTMRRIAEAERGGLSSRESTARYERGENPGGLHHKAVRREGPEHERPGMEEPQERREKVPGGPRRIPVTRRGS